VVPGGVRLGKGRAQSDLVLLGQQRMTCSRRTALVAHPVGSRPVVAARELANPLRAVPRHPRDGGSGQPACQEPQELPAAALDGVVREAIPLLQLVGGQRGMEADTLGHVSVFHQLPTTMHPLSSVSSCARGVDRIWV
jgi:hypothetical protein